MTTARGSVPKVAERMAGSQRRKATLTAAAAVFAREGYHGATTERIAQAAGISQPYVVRMFGSKENLFLTVVDGCLEAVLEAFRAVLDDGQPVPVAARLGAAYRELATEDGVHLIVMQSYMLGADPVIGPVARDGFTRILRFLIGDAGLSESAAELFLAQGMLINTLLGIRLSDQDDPLARRFTESVFGPGTAGPGPMER
ncbi:MULTISPECIES: TetR/AcrR family transcriptional regulator [unclassified Curtobacterium]|uniref:TetR/AcrR family transcriptional regulator n=1 Tax=unclassified Curtobacterium TaxID=257496 RepID=UPI000D889303|nr:MULTISPECIES: TetR/AcrR family transcriptional regulator [unclassified Curtobacterium]PYY32490.1 TetR/AcrR family transcriptional regulator [Curtobacterium sp. MCBD17_030]PZE86865.1 TetR/AcrR family transcriptional regulator [Curtobacterium sp. MCBD17_032]